MSSLKPFLGPVFLAVVVAVLAVACGDKNDETTPPTSTTAATAADGSSVQEPATLRLGYFANVTHAPAIIGIREGIFAEALGPEVEIDEKHFNAGPALIEALFADELDIAYIGPNPAITGFVRSDGEALRVIAGATSGGALLVVRPEAGITSPADFAGKKVATPQLGNTQDVALRTWLRDNGLKTTEDGGKVTVLPTANADQLTLFLRREIDAAWAPEPWATRLIQEAGATVFLDEASLWPDGRFVTTHVIVRAKFLEQRPDVVAAFLEGHLDAIEFAASDHEHARRVVNEGIEEITSKPLPEAVIVASWENLEFTHDPVSASLYASADAAFDLGFLGSDKPELTGIYDLTLLNAALARRGQAGVQQ